MAGRLMAALDNPKYELRITLRHPAQDEERGSDVAIVQKIEDVFCISLHAAFEIAPGMAVDSAREGFNVEIILHVDGEDTPLHGSFLV